MASGRAEGTFDWTELEPHSRLAWHGPRARSGPGTMEPSGRWELADDGTTALGRLKQRLEAGQAR